MKTDDLISMLARESAALPPPRFGGAIRGAFALSIAIAVAWMVWRLGLNPDLRADIGLTMFWVKLGYPAALALLFGWALIRLGAPGRRAQPMLFSVTLIVAAIIVMGCFAGLSDAPAETMEAIGGEPVFDCPISIATLALPMFIASLWALRQFAPTHPTLAGAVAGMFSGAVGATIYALHCTGFHPSFVALWYTVGVFAPGIVGALVGRFVLRW